MGRAVGGAEGNQCVAQLVAPTEAAPEALQIAVGVVDHAHGYLLSAWTPRA
jgi:hypothetical protein